MATVYLASTEPAIGRQRFCALKVIHPHLEHDRSFVEMFVDEAEIASRIRHANVCAVLDFGFVDNRYYIAMEYLLGESMAGVFRRLVRQRRVDEDRLARCVARAMADACEGLHAAHELTDSDGEPLHIVHRDVSPENIQVTYDGIVKVLDFGVASASRKRHRTRTGIVKGKFAYVAPEFLRGTSKPERRADVWGVAVVAWELLTGQRLFRRETEIETLRAVCEDLILPPSKKRPGLPQELDDIVMRALSRDPEQRYATARDLGKDLARFAVAGDSIVSSDLAEWMEELFPGGKERNEQILQLAEQIQAEGTDRTPPRVQNAFGDATWSPSQELSASPSIVDAPVAAESEPPASMRFAPRESPPATATSECRLPATEWTATNIMPTRVAARNRAADAGPSLLKLWTIVTGATAVGVLAGATMVGWGMKALGYWPGSRTAPIVSVAAPPATAATRAVVASRVASDGARAALVRGEYVVEIDDGPSGEVVLRIHSDGQQASRSASPPPEAETGARPTTPTEESRTAAPTADLTRHAL